MNRFILLLAGILFCNLSFAQSKYYKGEWSKSNTTYVFNALIKLDYNGNKVAGEIIWTIVTADSTNEASIKYYKSKLNKYGLEVVSGNYNPSTRDLNFLGLSKIDPDTVMGVDIYSLKLTADKKVLTGKTDAGGTNGGFLYAAEINATAGEKEFNAMKAKLH